MVARVPKISFAPAAFIELELAIALFEKASVHPVVSYGLVNSIYCTNGVATNVYSAATPFEDTRSSTQCII